VRFRPQLSGPAIIARSFWSTRSARRSRGTLGPRFPHVKRSGSSGG